VQLQLNEGSLRKEGSFRATDGAADQVAASSVVRRGASSSRISVLHKQNSHAASIKRHKPPAGPVTATGTVPPRSDSFVEIQHQSGHTTAMESNRMPALVKASATFPGMEPGATAWVQFTHQNRRFIKTGKVVGLFKDRKFRIHFDDGTEHTISSTDNSWLVYG
jgi:hypothetical protein